MSSRIADLQASLTACSEPVRVHQGLASAYAHALSRLASDRDHLLVIVPDEDSAEEWSEDLIALQNIRGDAPAHEVLRLPGWEQSVYGAISPSIRTRHQRIATLAKLAAEPRWILVSTLAALRQSTIPARLLREKSLHLTKEADLGARSDFQNQLIALGYARVDTVEDPGTFAVRGEILDLFVPESGGPVRIELFDTLIERMRRFDPQSQLTLKDGEVTRFEVWPAREVLIGADNSAALRERLKEFCDTHAISKAVRDPLAGLIQDGIYPTHSDAWAPFAYGPAVETPLDHLESLDPFVAWHDELTCLQNWDEFREKEEIACTHHLDPEKAARSQSNVAPLVADLFAETEKAEAFLRRASRLFLDKVSLVTASEEDDAPPVEGEPLIRTNHRLQVKANREFLTQPRRAEQVEQHFEALEKSFALWVDRGFRLVFFCSTQSQRERIQFFLSERPALQQAAWKLEAQWVEASLSEGFRWPAERLVALTDAEFFGSKKAGAKRASAKSAAQSWAGLQSLSDLAVGDTVIHVDHGIGRYQGLVRLSLSGAPSDFLQIEYAGKDKLYLPVYRLNVVQKYGSFSADMELDRLGSQAFAKEKEKVREAVRKLAFDLVRLYAEREVKTGVSFAPRDAQYREFEASFAFEETADQLKAIEDTHRDLERGKVMDRLICGDVGYGKTEVAIRAAYRAVMNGKQVAVLVPTTLLAFQHEQSFRARLADTAVRVESCSRFKTAKEQKDILAALGAGKVDIIVGTHRLLSNDVRFQDLGLLVIDEEHRFGVEHKEKIKTLKVDTHVQTLTATPIPRTLHMALSGIRDISLIKTPPVNRLPIRTYVSKYDEELIKKAVSFELARDGQVFFLHNRVQTIHEVAKKIEELVPGAKVAVGHGQMSEGELEKVMMSFYSKEKNVLVATTIIESGLDIPSANTILIDRADTLGLAQLYQIRGRVGRGQARAYAYLLIPAETAISEDAKKRLEVIQRFVELGSGFSIASHDLEIRGGGDILGAQQSGHIAAVGFDMYLELLNEAILSLKGEEAAAERSLEPEIKAPFGAFLAEEYVADVHQRLSIYRRVSAAENEDQLAAIESELIDRFGPLPPEAANLFWMVRIKLMLKRIGVASVTVGPERVVLVPHHGKTKLDPAKVISVVVANPKRYSISPESKFILTTSIKELSQLSFELDRLFQALS